MENVGVKLSSAFGLIAVGIVLRRLGLLRKADGEVLFRFIFNVTLPAMLLQVFLSIVIGTETLMIVVSSLMQTAVLLGFALFFWRDNEHAAVLAGSTVGVNLGIFAYPLTEAVWGALGLQAATVFDLTNQWTILVISYLLFHKFSTLERDDIRKTILRRLANPCFISVYLALFLRITGHSSLPNPISSIVESLAAANKAISLVTVGVVLEPKLRKNQLADIICLLGLRYGVSLTLAGAFIQFSSSSGIMGSFGPEKTAAVLIALTSPVPMMTVTYAFEFAADTQRAVAAVNLSNIISAALFFVILNTEGYTATARSSIALIGSSLFACAATIVIFQRKRKAPQGIAARSTSACLSSVVSPLRTSCTRMRVLETSVSGGKKSSLHQRPLLRVRSCLARTIGRAQPSGLRIAHGSTLPSRPFARLLN